LPRAPEPKAELYEKAIRAAQAKLVSVGITATKDPGVSEGEIKAYRNLRMAKELQVRINTLYNIRNKRLKEMETLMAGWLSIYGTTRSC